MQENAWRFTGLKLRGVVCMLFLSLFFVTTKESLSSPLSIEGLALLMFKDRVISDPFNALSSWNANDGVIDPCLWFGVECSEGKVVTLNLKDLCLQGTIAPEIGKLTHIKSIILRNNSFFGEIPKEMLQLEELEVLDLGYNNLSGSCPFESNPSLTTLLLDNNAYLTHFTPQVFELKMVSESHINEELLAGSATTKAACVNRSSFWYKRHLLHISIPPSSLPPDSELFSPSSILVPPSEPPLNSPSAPSPTSTIFLPPSPSPSPASSPPPIITPSPSPASSPPPIITPSPSPASSPSPKITPSPETSLPANPPSPQSNSVSAPSFTLFSNQRSPKPKHRSLIIWSTIGGFSFLVLLSAIAFACFRNSKLATGVPNLKRAELEAACEGFTNIIGSLPEGIIYKGIRSSGAEIAVVSTTVVSPQNWSKHMEAQFRKKLETLSKVNHKNFENLIGFCEEKKPFTRMMMFEHAPNGTLHEYLHNGEAEHLEWATRVRIAMGIAYCLEYLHQLTPLIALTNLQSSSICLTEDFAAKISCLSFWNDIVTTTEKGSSAAKRVMETPLDYTKANVYSFGVILFELITGRIPYAVDHGVFADWAAEYVRWGKKPLRDVVDPTLNSLEEEEEIEKWFQVIKECVDSDPEKRPAMTEVTAALKEITAMGPDAASLQSSPIWWAELEIMARDLW